MILLKLYCDAIFDVLDWKASPVGQEIKVTKSTTTTPKTSSTKESRQRAQSEGTHPNFQFF